MNFSIRGKLIKSNEEWSIEIPLLDYVIKEVKPLMCLRKLEQQLKEELQDENLKCFFKIDDSGVFYILTAQTPELIDYIAEKMVDLNAIKLEPGLED